mgnify:CR=1 FL=1
MPTRKEKDERNARDRWKYANDPEYRKRVLAYNRKSNRKCKIEIAKREAEWYQINKDRILEEKKSPEFKEKRKAYRRKISRINKLVKEEFKRAKEE